MSVLLDALKKAALEKQKREQVVDHFVDHGHQNHSHQNRPHQNIGLQQDEIIEPINNGIINEDIHRQSAQHSGSVEEEPSLNIEIDFDELEQPEISETELSTEISQESLSIDIGEQALDIVEKPTEAKVKIEENDDKNKEPPTEIDAKTEDIKEPVEPEDNENIKKTDTFIQTEKTQQVQKKSFKTLIEKNRRLDKEKKRKFIMLYLILVILAIVVVGSYFYFVSINSTSTFVSYPLDNVSVNTATDDANYGEDAELVKSMADVASAQQNTAEKVIVEEKAVAPVPIAATSNTQSNATSKPSRQTRQSKNITPAAPAKVIKLGKPKLDALGEAIERAFSAYSQGKLDLAKEDYDTALKLDPFHRDALLGSAAVAMAQQRYQDALELYQRRLARAPKDEYAQGGILSIAGVENVSPELFSRVNTLLKEYPAAAHLHFLKGALYAVQSRWAAAQLAFFNAWSRAPKRADYAYNLAVALDHIDQHKEALRFYKNALQYAAVSPVGLDIAAVTQRIAQLEAMP